MVNQELCWKEVVAINLSHKGGKRLHWQKIKQKSWCDKGEVKERAEMARSLDYKQKRALQILV